MDLVTKIAQISSGNDLAEQVREGEGMLRRIEELPHAQRQENRTPKPRRRRSDWRRQVRLRPRFGRSRGGCNGGLDAPAAMAADVCAARALCRGLRW